MSITTIEGNRLIAEFMGGTYHELETGFGQTNKVVYFLPGNNPNPHCNAGTYKRVAELDYRVRWDWLMPVVEKIKKFYTDESDNYPLDFWEEDVTIIDLKITESIGLVWDYSIRFIQWYNENKLKSFSQT